LCSCPVGVPLGVNLGHVLLGLEHDAVHDVVKQVFLALDVQRWGDRPILRYSGRVISYAQLDEMTNRYAHGFASQGIRRGAMRGFWEHLARRTRDRH